MLRRSTPERRHARFAESEVQYAEASRELSAMLFGPAAEDLQESV